DHVVDGGCGRVVAEDVDGGEGCVEPPLAQHRIRVDRERLTLYELEAAAGEVRVEALVCDGQCDAFQWAGVYPQSQKMRAARMNAAAMPVRMNRALMTPPR